MIKDFEKKESAREAAFKILNRVDASGSYADILLEAELGCMEESERPLTVELVYGILRFRIKIDWIISEFSSIKPKRLEHKVLNALRLGAYQLLFLTKIPPSAAVNESVNLIKPEGKKKAGFVNAVLRKINEKRDGIHYPGIKDPVKHISIVYSHPEWLVKRWIERYGIEDTIKLCKANLEVPPKTLRVNTLTTDRARLVETLSEEGVEVKKASCSPDGVEVLSGKIDSKDKRYYIQDEASQLIAYLVKPSPGETILDACSAPGGKTTHMAQLMENRGRIIALDKYSGRLKSVVETAERLQINIIEVLEADAGKPLKLKGGTPLFDAILCDAPCSGLGVLRRAPDIKYRRKEEDIKEISERQKRILSNLAGYVKKGGRMIYSTCTFEPEETDDIIKWFLDAHRDFIIEEAGGYVPEECKPLVDEPGVLRTYPHRHGMDGFFAARLKKI